SATEPVRWENRTAFIITVPPVLRSNVLPGPLAFTDMNIEITPKKTDGLERLIEVRVPVETVRDAEEKAARRYATNVRLPGFRPGKAPPAMVKKRFKDAIRQQVIEPLVQEACQEVISREQLQGPSQP